MNTNELQALEGYFKTKNEHWNGYAFQMLCEVLEQGNFENPETPLQLFSNSIDIFTDNFRTPLKAYKIFEGESNKLTFEQKLFVLEWVLKYLRNSEFKNANTETIQELLKSQITRIKHEIRKQFETNKLLTGKIRDTLKDMMQKELEQLPETLKELEPVQRLNILCKLMPFVLPKVESVDHTFGEPES